MLQIAGIQSINQISLNLLSLLFMTTVKSAIVFLVAFSILQTLKSFAPGYKHILWFFVICGFILIPVISILAPIFQFTILRSNREGGELFRVFHTLVWPQITHAETVRGFAQSDSPVSSGIVPPFSSGLSWSSWALILWVTGIVGFSLRIIIGRIVLLPLLKQTQSNTGQRSIRLLDTLQRELVMTRSVVLLKSSKCTVPFTCNVFKPIIVFPSDLDEWPEGRIRVVLIHELAHIRRRDNLTQMIARIICSILWFIPFVWIAYSNLYCEQEKAADAFVVSAEEKPVDYARHLLGFARYYRKHVMSPGLFLSRGRKRMLEKRIVNILGFERRKASSEGLKMKYLILMAILISAFIALIGSCTTTKNAISEEDLLDALSGTWVNVEYEYKGGSGPHQKIVIYPDGKYEFYGMMSHDTPGGKGTFSIMDRWTDSKGTIWYRYRGRDLCLKGIFYEVGKMNGSGKKREIIVSASEITFGEWDSPLHTHRFYFSQ